MKSLKWSVLPVLDFARFEVGESDKEAFLVELRQTARELGFFYLTGHGINPNLIKEVLDLSRRFFDLPTEDKLAIEMVNSPHFRGYTRVGWERTRGQPDWREQLDLGADRTALPTNAGFSPWLRLHGPNQWPSALPELAPIVKRYQAALTDLAKRLLRAFAAALGQPETIFESAFSPDPHLLLKIIRYPGRAATETDQGVGAHKDSGCITILLQDVQPGLQVEHDGEWLDAPPMPGTFIVNMGEMLEVASNGYLRATVHRVVRPPANLDRLSVAFFLTPRLDAIMPSLVLPPSLAADVPGITRDPLNPIFNEVGKNQLKSRLRSHPDVAQRHHADLIEAMRTETV